MPTLNLLSKSAADMDKIDKAFCFASSFEIQISDILADTSDAHRNAKATTLRAFEGNTAFWDENTKCGNDAITLRRQLYKVLKQQNVQ